MKTIIAKAAAKYSSICQNAHAVVSTAVSKHAMSLMLVAGFGLIISGSAPLVLAQGGEDKIGEAADIILTQLIEGAFGALIMIVAGLVAIIAAAMGAYRAAMAALVVAVGAFVLRAFVEIFFPGVVGGGAAA